MFALCFHDHVYVRVLLIDVQHHRISMLECEFLSGKVSCCRYDLLRGSRRRHGEHEFVNQLDLAGVLFSVAAAAILTLIRSRNQ